MNSNSTHKVPRVVPLLLQKMLHEMPAHFLSLSTQSEQMSYCYMLQAGCRSVGGHIRNRSLGRINATLGLALGLAFFFFFFLSSYWLSFLLIKVEYEHMTPN